MTIKKFLSNEKIAKKANTTWEEKHQEHLKKKQLKAFKSLKRVKPGSLLEKSIQSIKEEMGRNI